MKIYLSPNTAGRYGGALNRNLHSALIKYFHLEKGSETIEALIINSDNTLWISELSRIEFLSAIHRKYRTKEINAAQLSDQQ